MANANLSNAVDLGLDEWGIWADEIDVADLYARARHRRRFGGHIVSTADTTTVGAADIHVFKLTASEYGFALEHGRTGGTFVADGSRRSIVAEVLDRADLDGFTGAGIDDADMGDVPRRVHGAEESVFDILWALRSRTKLLTIEPVAGDRYPVDRPWRGIRRHAGQHHARRLRARVRVVTLRHAGARDGSWPSHGHG